MVNPYILRLRWVRQNESVITSVTNIIEEKFVYCHEALKCCTQWNKSTSIGAAMKELWSFKFFQYISYGEAV